MPKAGYSLAIAVSLVVLSPVAAHADPGALDPTFGGDGTVTTRVSSGGGFDVAYGVAVHDDKIVAVGTAEGTFAAVRYTSDGALDGSFAGDGTAITPVAGNDTAYAVAVQPDGKIIAAGVANNDAFALVRYTADGALDQTFGDRGKVITGFTGGPDTAYAVTLQPDRKIIAVGQAGAGGIADIAIARYHPDGTLDASFGTNGTVVTSGAGNDVAYAVTLHEDKILVAGMSDGMMAVARYDATGVLDTSFGAKGIARIADGAAYAVALQGRDILVAGSSGLAFAVARVDQAGQLDSTFGDAGTATTPLSSGQDAAWGMVLHGDKIVLGGVVSDSFGLARYTADGVLDPSFDDDGTVLTNFTNETDSAYAIALQSDGRIVAAGSAGENAGLADFALARYEP